MVGADVQQARPIEQAHVAIGWRGPDHNDPDRYAMAVANQVLGGGWSSRLFQEVRERRGMAYTVFSAAGAYVDAGTFSVYAGTSPDRADELIDVVDRELSSLVNAGPSEHEVNVARGGFAGATVIGLEDTGARMTRLATALTVRDRVVDVDEYLANIEAVTADDVRDVLGKVVGGPRVSSIVSP